MLPQTTATWKTEYQLRAEATQARRRAAGRYTRPTKAQREAFAKAMQRAGRKNLTAAECELLANHPNLAASQRAEFATMAAQRRFAAMCAAMVGDDEVEATIDEVMGKPQLGVEDSAGLMDYDAEADDYEDYLADVEFIRGGC